MSAYLLQIAHWNLLSQIGPLLISFRGILVFAHANYSFPNFSFAVGLLPIASQVLLDHRSCGLCSLLVQQLQAFLACVAMLRLIRTINSDRRRYPLQFTTLAVFRTDWTKKTADANNGSYKSLLLIAITLRRLRLSPRRQIER